MITITARSGIYVYEDPSYVEYDDIWVHVYDEEDRITASIPIREIASIQYSYDEEEV